MSKYAINMNQIRPIIARVSILNVYRPRLKSSHLFGGRIGGFPAHGIQRRAMSSSGQVDRKRVAVIGAGPAGLVTTRHLAAAPQHFEVTCFERTGSIGGEWNFTEKVEPEEGYRQTGLYPSLRTNTNRQCTEFPDFPFPAGTLHWPTYEDVHDYLYSFADNFSLLEHIKLKHQVQRVWLKDKDDDGHAWGVEAKDRTHGKTYKYEFDAVVVCIGMLHSPVIPYIPGASDFRGRSIHSCQYRGPEPFTGERVLVIGGKVSAWDMCWDVGAAAEKIFMSHRSELMIELHPNSESVSNIVALTSNAAVFEDGSELPIDSVIYCTGYNVELPFLDNTCGVSVKDSYIHPLYKRVIQPELKSLFFVGTYHWGANFPNYWMQAKLALAVISGKASLPPTEDMMKEVDEEFRDTVESGLPPVNMHRIGYRQGEYAEAIALLAGEEPLPAVTSAMWCATLNEDFSKNYHNLKRIRFEEVEGEIVKSVHKEYQ